MNPTNNRPIHPEQCMNHVTWPNNIWCTLVNCRSAVNKATEIKTVVTNNKIDICILMEKWIRLDDTTTTTQLCPPNYDIISIPRKDYIGGGLALIYNKRLNTNLKSSYSFNTMECSDFIPENRNGRTIFLCLLFRLPNTNVTDYMGELV